ncbi:MAG TPA: GspE/PulE family protein, partial [Sedimentisphaerales bacterium]|nr:GspE/PulE family protein [Sedimentisphaerales bacterium]
VPESIAKRFCLMPVTEINGRIVVAMADPLDVIARDTIRLKLDREIETVIGCEEDIRHAIEWVYHGSDAEEQRIRDLVYDEDQSHRNETAVVEAESKEIITDISAATEAGKAPVIQFVDLLLSQAVKSRASDIHVEPQEKNMTIRLRIDGMLREVVPPPPRMQPAVVTRVKILSGMDVAERRLPQDGRFKVRATGRDIDVRVSVIPTIYGEKVVMRILDKGALTHDLNSLGLADDILRQFKIALSQPHGIIIVTGPTGSGKSTTLYSALNYLRDPKKNITTVEDPVEYRLAGINQIQVKSDINLDFAACLRAILRQDPDIILIGEIRDKETVEIAIKASLTGHLVLSTFHTNDAASALSRLNYMGIERYLLASSLNVIIAQRLVRRICEKCKESSRLDEELARRLKMDRIEATQTVIYRGKGCSACGGTGYLGRLPVFEYMPIDGEMREKIVAAVPEAELRALARSKGYGGLFESGIARMRAGLTTPEEVLRVTFTEDQ